MKKSTISVMASGLSALLLVTGCASYKAGVLPSLQPEFSPYSSTIDGVTLSVKALASSDSKRILNRDILAAGYQPIQITIRNDSDNYIMFSSQGVGLPVVPPQEVAEKVHTSTVGRATAYGVAGLIVWPLLIPAVVDGVGSSKANAELDRDFEAKSVEQMVIQPYATHNGILFVPMSEYQNSFNVTLIERKTKKKFAYRVTGI